MEANTELPMQRARVVADNVKAAAFGWALRPERADDYVVPSLHRLGHLADISRAFVGACKEMKHGAVMPHIVGTRLQLHARDIADEPTDTF